MWSLTEIAGLLDSLSAAATNKFYYGDTLNVLRRDIKDESVDLVYLDPPFNSNQNYSVFFKKESGDAAQAQIEAFDDNLDVVPRVGSCLPRDDERPGVQSDLGCA